MRLTSTMQKFILHWGEMGARWGVNRTVAQVHALLYISPRPLPADEIATTLSVARSNVSTSLRELQSWGLARVVHVLGDRRNHFETFRDVWTMFRIVLAQRKRREIDPTMALLREAVSESSKGGAAETFARERLAEMLDFFETAMQGYEEFARMSPAMLQRLVKYGGKVQKLLAGGRTGG